MEKGGVTGMDKFLTQDTIFYIVVVIWAIIQSGIFATKLDVAKIKIEMLQLKDELKEYSDDGDRELLHNLDEKYQSILNKLDNIR